MSKEFLHLEAAIRSCIDCGAKDVTHTKTGLRKEAWRVKGVPEKATRLTESASNPVPGSGPEQAKVVVVGEAPGVQEDEDGVPFVGRSGKYLRDVLLPAAGVRASNVRFLNVVRCHPERNRDPYAGEIKACSKWLNLELQLVRPSLILALGAVAVKSLLPGVGLKESHGQVYEWNGIPTVALYHPAAKDRAVPASVLEGDYKRVQGKLMQYKSPIPHEVTRTLIKDRKGLNDLVYMIRGYQEFGFDIETNETEWARTVMDSPDPLTNELAGMSFAFDLRQEGRQGFFTAYVPTTDHPDGLMEMGDLGRYTSWEHFRRYMTRRVLWESRAKLIIHNAKFEFRSLQKYLPREFYKQKRRPEFEDTMLLAYNEGQETVGLKACVKRMFGVTQTPLEDIINLKKQQIREAPLAHVYPYACDDAYWAQRLEGEWKEKGSFYQQQKRLLWWGVETETRGVDVALERVGEIEELIDEQLGGLRESIDGWTGKDSVKEINSPAEEG